MKSLKLSFICVLIGSNILLAQNQSENFVSKAWVSDLGNGNYQNPIINADYSDPDVIRVKDDYYMTASSFNCVPGLPILHSKDLVNWKLINYALKKQPPFEVYNTPQHGNGVWAPCIRFHNEEFYIFYPDPEYGIYMVKTKNPKENWSEPILIKEGKGIIDPTPLWDDDGKVYLAYAFAGSRAGIKSLLAVCTLNKEATKANDDDVLLIDGHLDESTIEGPKFYKRNGYYYIFAPAGGVATGWQTVLRAKNILGPYEKRKVMEQGKTAINGPHQGAWVETQKGENWFFHFQDKGVYGRVVHLQPMKWKNDWPIIGVDDNNDGIGEPVITYKKPAIDKKFSIETPVDSDEFNDASLGLQWQWHANPQVYWGFPSALGHYTLYCRPKPENFKNLFDVGNLLLQKLPNDEFTATTKLTFNARFDKEQIGFVAMGLDYTYLKIQQNDTKLYISQVTCKNADKKSEEIELKQKLLTNSTLYLRTTMQNEGWVSFSFSYDGEKFENIGEPFKVREGKWIGAKIGFFALRDGFTNDAGSVDIDWFRIK